MASKYVTTQQYEPLRTPAKWTSEERVLLQQLTDRFDELYSRLNRLRFEDLGKVMQSRIETIEGYSTDIQQNANQIALKASQQTVDDLTGRVTDAETSLTLKADAATLQSVSDSLLSQLNVIPGQITAAVSQGVYNSSEMNKTTGQQLVLSLSRGTILDKNNTATIATARIFENGVDITASVPASVFRWERVSDDTAGDAVWNANASHIGVKSITIAAADVAFRCVIRCVVDEVSPLATGAVTNSSLLITDGQDDTGSDFSINANGELIYNGDSQYSIVDGYLTAQTATTSFIAELTYSNLKTSFISIYPEGIDIFSSGKINMEAGSEMNLKAGNVFNLRAGTGSSAIGLSNNEANGYMQWAGNADPAAAPYSVKRDGSVKMTKLTLGNSAITDLTQMYAQTFSDNADPAHAAVIRLYVPSEAVGVQSLKLSFQLEAYRAFSTTTETTETVEKTSAAGGAGTVTSASSILSTGSVNESITLTPSGNNLTGEASGNTGSSGALVTENNASGSQVSSLSANTGMSTGSTGSGGTGNTGTPAGSTTTSGPSPISTESANPTTPHSHGLNSHTHGLGGHYHSGPSHTHSLNSHQHDMSHTHVLNQHTHGIAAHYHTLANHQHNLYHEHIFPGHTHYMGHTHDVTISGHTHKVTIDGHSHAITYGIYEGNRATSCTVEVDGNTVGSFASMNAQNITDYLTKEAGKITRNTWHTVTITPDRLTRIVAHAFIIMVVGSATNAIY